MAVPIQVTFDCANPDAQAHFWADILGYQLQPPPDGYTDWPTFLREHGVPEDRMDSASAIVDPAGAGARIFFQKVPEGKTAKNRVHLDVNVGAGYPAGERRGRVDAAVERALGLGATRLRTVEEFGEYCVVMQDPEGNEFCLQ